MSRPKTVGGPVLFRLPLEEEAALIARAEREGKNKHLMAKEMVIATLTGQLPRRAKGINAGYNMSNMEKST